MLGELKVVETCLNCEPFELPEPCDVCGGHVCELDEGVISLDVVIWSSERENWIRYPSLVCSDCKMNSEMSISALYKRAAAEKVREIELHGAYCLTCNDYCDC